jgi:hypothetical protein
MTVKSVLAAAVLAMLASPASAVVLPVDHYNMPNGFGTQNLGDYNYWDATYSGTGNKTTDGAPLTGGTGALTDGVIANQQYDSVSNAAGTGQYVGWKYTDPLISFQLANLSTVSSISFFVDNSYVGLVGAPETITVNGQNYTPFVTHPFGANNPAIQLVIAFESAITASLFNITPHAGPFGPDALAYNLLYPGDPIPGDRQPWMMISEVQFNGVSAVPELSTWIMMLAGFAGVGFLAYRRQRKANPAAA